MQKGFSLRQPRQAEKTCALSLLVTMLAGWASTAQAAHFAWASAETHVVCRDAPDCPIPRVLNDFPGLRTSADYLDPQQFLATTQGQISNGGSVESFEVYAAASADLATGTLRAMAKLDNTAPAMGRTAYVRAQAFIGDSFSFASSQGGAFSWRDGATATLEIQLHGLLSKTSVDSQAPAYGLSFWIYRHGDIESGAIGWGSQLAGAGWYDPYGSGVYQAWSAGMLPITTEVSGDPTGDGLNLRISFAPGDDFDWVLDLNAQAELTDLPGSKLADFSHTMTARFIAPAGAVVTSSSGLFPVTAAVPEPGAWGLMLAGLVAVGAGARRRVAD